MGLGRDGVVYVPETAEPCSPVLVFLHGAGSSGDRALRRVLGAADRYGVAVVAPDSRTQTWDVIAGGRFGPDVAFLDLVLATVADRYDVDLARLALGGFSDGASYAVSLGLTNGDLFGAVLAFSPGFARPQAPMGRPPIFVTHGTADPVLPIDVCSRVLVPALRGHHYDVAYREFPGGHQVPPELADEAVGWWLGQSQG